MKITVRNEYRTEVLLSSAEMDLYGITYDEIDYAKVDTRRILWSLVNDVRRLSGVEISLSGRLLIEVFREKNGEVRICFSKLKSEKNDPVSLKQLVKAERAPVTAEFENAGNLLDFSCVLDTSADSLLYEKDGRYRLFIYPLPEEKERLLRVLCEYAKVLPENPVNEAVCREMWTCLINKNALEALHGCFK